MKKTPVFILLLFFISFQALGQFTISGEFRPRLELRHGYRALPDATSEMAAFVNQRSRIGMLFQSEKLDVFGSFQEVRVWGSKGMMESNPIPGLGFHQAYVDLKFSKQLTLRAGRQEIRYDNQRLFGNNNWNQFGRVHDAAVLRYKKDNLNIHFGAAFNQQTELNFGTNYTGNEYKSLNYLWVNNKFNKLTLSGLLVADGYQKAGTTNTTYLRYTYGAVATQAIGKNSIEGQVYLQSGKTKTGQKINAWYLMAQANIVPVESLSLSVGGEIFSGADNTKTNEKYLSFEPLYGATHAFNGHLDFFTSFPSHTKNAGLINPFMKMVYTMSEKANIKADFHYFALQNKAVYGTSNTVMDKYLGTEVDLIFQYFLTKTADIQVGYSTMFATESLQLVKGSGSYKEPINWAWAMLTVRPTFLNTK